MIIEKFEVPTESRFKLINHLRYVKARNYYRCVAWEIRRLEDNLVICKSDLFKKCIRENLNYLKKQRKAVLDYLE